MVAEERLTPIGAVLHAEELVVLSIDVSFGRAEKQAFSTTVHARG